MKKLLLTICITLISVIKMVAQESTPVIEFSTTEVNYGVIIKNSEGKRSFSIKNTGNAPLVIKSCSGSCGCTVPTCPQEPIMPGKTSVVDVRYDTSRLGPFSKLVTVYSNDPKNGVATVVIKGEVKEP